MRSCRFQELIELMEAHSGDCENGQENGAPAFGDVIAMGAGYFLDQPVSPQHAELAADG